MNQLMDKAPGEAATASSEAPKVNSARAWFLAARPKTLTGAAVPVMIGCAMAYPASGSRFALVAALLCLGFAFLMQIDSNFINDYFDCIRGNDDRATRLGPKRACAEGWITLKAMRRGLVVTSLLACMVGLPLILYGGMALVAVGAVCVVFAFLYTTFFSYKGLGDLLVLVFFGIVPVCFTYYVTVPEPHIPAKVFWASVACGMIIDKLLIVNNYRDRDNDLRDGKMTLVVRFGVSASEWLYLALGLIAPAMIVSITLVQWGLRQMTWQGGLVVTLLFLIPVLAHWDTWRKMKEVNHGRALNRILGLTSRDMFLFGICASLSLL